MDAQTGSFRYPAGTHRGLVSQVQLTRKRNGVPSDCVVNLDSVHMLPRSAFRRRVQMLSTVRLAQAWRALVAATGC